MKKESALLARQSRKPRLVGRSTCAAALGSAPRRVAAAHSGTSACWLSSFFHLMASEDTHQKLAT